MLRAISRFLNVSAIVIISIVLGFVIAMTLTMTIEKYYLKEVNRPVNQNWEVSQFDDSIHASIENDSGYLLTLSCTTAKHQVYATVTTPDIPDSTAIHVDYYRVDDSYQHHYGNAKQFIYTLRGKAYLELTTPEDHTIAFNISDTPDALMDIITCN